MTFRSLAACGALVPVLALAACGGSDDKGASKDVSKDNGRSKAEVAYIAKADKICAIDGAAIDNVTSKLTKKSTTSDYAKLQKVVVPALRREIKKLRALEKPRGDEKALNKIYDDAAAATARLGSVPPSKVAGLYESNVFEKANREALGYGLLRCGS